MFDTRVTPSLPGAVILDPSRGRALPPDGAPVVWSPYWAKRERRGEITATPIPPEAPATAEAPAAAEAAPIEADPAE
ncbi:hypothetical protein [Methylobacterium frigidaeris]|uniref:DUF2635 domain-containing protein n=1 Tax=Methylobacterium frigidaeris TaxID=2038277 RepID=A0AA37HFM8_9HYPH|nr:hypothetical protein [Methylobacterium frigidaeris]PIK74820.1 hypothetical protein CS379_00540 [Methylobacterium frigidaeris]GJD65172.1 hypothetical protein MPEAHAMD_5359 [Methylobacterium frigidaeris]